MAIYTCIARPPLCRRRKAGDCCVAAYIRLSNPPITFGLNFHEFELNIARSRANVDVPKSAKNSKKSSD